MTAAGSASRRGELYGLVALTALAFALRLPLMGQSLSLDEPHAWAMAEGSLGGVFRELRGGYEIHPPLYFVLAWLAGQVGDPTVWVRVPSLVLSTACVPLTYLLGRRTVGAPAAAIGAALVAVSPFAVRAASDARPYATLMFVTLLSTYALVVAVGSGRARWWALYAVAVCAVMYTHYFGAFVILAQALWVFTLAGEHRRKAVLSYAAAALGYLPWVPSLLEQPHKTSDFAGIVPLSARFIGEELILVLPGNGFNGVREILGLAALVVLALAVAALLLVALREARARGGAGRPSPAVVLLMLVAASTPIALLAFSLLDANVWLSRYLGTSLPVLALLLGALAMRVPRPVAVATVGVALAVLAAGTVHSYAGRFARADYKGAAHYLEDSVRPGDVVFEIGSATQARNRLRISPIDLNFKRDLPVTFVPSTGPEEGFPDLSGDASVFVAGVDYGAFLQLPRPAPQEGLCAVRRRAFDGFLAVYQYRRAVADPGGGGAGQARLEGDHLRLSTGARLPLVTGKVRGHVDLISDKGDDVEITAWAIDGEGNPAGCVLAFDGSRLVGFAMPNLQRPDVEQIYGRRAASSGFNFRTDGPAAPDRLRVVAVADGEAAELMRP